MHSTFLCDDVLDNGGHLGGKTPSFIFYPFLAMLDLVKGASLNLVKEDGTSISKIRVGLAWDQSDSGTTADLDLFVIAPDKATVAFYNAKTAISGVSLSEDNRTGEGEGDDEFAKFDAAVTTDGVYTIALNIYDGKNKGQTFAQVKNAKATVYNDETNEVLATVNISADGGANESLIVGTLTDSGNNYVFTAKGDYILGDINQVVASI
jgi:tellurium resistance protein TerD